MNPQQRFDLVNSLTEQGKCAFYKLREFEDKYPESLDDYEFNFITFKIDYKNVISEELKNEINRELNECLSRTH